MKFMTLWTDDWIAGTHPLTPEERGVYITMICHFINKDRVVPDSDIYLARLCNLSTRAYRRVKKTLIDGDFLELRDGHLWIERTAKQYKKDQGYSKKQAEKARKKARYERANKLETKETKPAIPSPSPSPSPKGIKNTKKVGVNKWVTDQGIEAGRRVAPGYDIRFIEAQFKEWSSGKSIRNHDAAFIKFTQTHVERNPL